MLVNLMPKKDSPKINGDSIPSGKYNWHWHGKPIFHYIIVLLVIANLAVSTSTLIIANQIKKSYLSKTVNVNDFLKKLTAHNEMTNYTGVVPLNIIQINSNNIDSLRTQINGLDVSYIGAFIVEYSDKIIIYDYDNDKLRLTSSLHQAQEQLPTDFLAKLNKHIELQGLQNQQPVGGKLDKSSLDSLKQQLPAVYANAKVGNFLLRYKTKLIIYDYNNDKIVNAVNLE